MKRNGRQNLDLDMDAKAQTDTTARNPTAAAKKTFLGLLKLSYFKISVSICTIMPPPVLSRSRFAVRRCGKDKRAPNAFARHGKKEKRMSLCGIYFPHKKKIMFQSLG